MSGIGFIGGRRAAGLVAALTLLAPSSVAAYGENLPAYGGAPAACVTVNPAQLGRQLDATRSLALQRFAAADIPPYDRFPARAAAAANAWTRTGPGAWTAGFYPATLWQVYAATREASWLLRARRWTAGLLAQATNATTHDLGFMLDISAGRGASLDPDPRMRARYRAAVVTAARTLASRFDPEVGAVKSGEYGGTWGLIVDSAMNMPLLLDGAAFTSDPALAARLRTIAVTHLRTLARDFVRPDGSTYHRLGYDSTTGALLGPLAGQGASPTSTWSRGQAWALYGFALGYTRTRDATLLGAARRVSAFWLAHQPADCVPWWDLSDPGSAPRKDSSAAAIASAGLLALAAVEPDRARAATDRRVALAAVARLTVRPYSTLGTSSPSLLRRSTLAVGPDQPEGSYIWGDHYLFDSAVRASRLVATKPIVTLTAGRPRRAAVPLAVRVRTYDGRPAAVGVVVEALPRGARQWRAAARVRTSATGIVSVAVRPVVPIQYRVLVPATAGLAAVTSKVLRVAPR